jgi:hypothetical protein
MFRHEAGTNITVANTTFIKLGCENCPNMSHMEARGARVGMHVVSFLQHEDPLPFRIDEDVRLVVDGMRQGASTSTITNYPTAIAYERTCSENCFYEEAINEEAEGLVEFLAKNFPDITLEQ